MSQLIKGIMDSVQIIECEEQPRLAVITYPDWQRVMAYVLITANKQLDIPTAVLLKVLRSRVTPIRAWREHLDLTQQEMADRLDISQAAYSQLERRCSPRVVTVNQVACAMGISVAQLMW